MLANVARSDAQGADRAEWFALAKAAFARAYGADEPDYSHCIGKMPPSG